MAKLPLDGIRIIDLTEVWAGPYATQILADWGAEVIWVESRYMTSMAREYYGPHVDPGMPGKMMSARPNRIPGKRPWNRCPVANAHGRNKLSMTVNLRSPEGADIFKRLVKVSDVVIDNRGPGTMEKLGLGYNVLKELKPDIIMVRMPGFGLSGPYKEFRSYGEMLDPFVCQAFETGYRDMDASQQPITVHGDAIGGEVGALSMLMALHYRNRTGKGMVIELAQVESLVSQFGEAIMRWTLCQLPQVKLGNRDNSAIQGCYPCKGDDRWVNITINTDKEWEGFCRALGNPSWCQDGKFGDIISRYENHDELDKLISKWTAQHDNYEIMHLLQKEGVAAGPVMTERDCYSDPHLEARGYFQELTQVDTGTYRYPGTPFTMNKTSNKIRRPPVLFGEHNEYIYKNIIGVSDQEYAELEKAGHIGMDMVVGQK